MCRPAAVGEAEPGNFNPRRIWLARRRDRTFYARSGMRRCLRGAQGAGLGMMDIDRNRNGGDIDQKRRGQGRPGPGNQQCRQHPAAESGDQAMLESLRPAPLIWCNFLPDSAFASRSGPAQREGFPRTTPLAKRRGERAIGCARRREASEEPLSPDASTPLVSDAAPSP